MNNVEIKVSKEKKESVNGFRLFVLQYILIVMFAMGSLEMLFSYMYFEYVGYVAAASLLAALICLLCIRAVRINEIIAVVPLAVTVAYFVLCRHYVVNGFFYIISSMDGYAKSSGYYIPFDLDKIDLEYSESSCVKAVILFAAMIFSLVYSIFVVQRKGTGLGALLMLLCAISGILVDIKPYFHFFAFCVVGCIMLIIIMLNDKIDSYSIYKNCIISGLSLMLMALLISIVIPETRFARNKSFDNAKIKIEAGFNNIMAAITNKNFSSITNGKIKHGSLDDKFGSVKYDGKTDFIAEVPDLNRDMYFKTYTANYYEDGRWVTAGDEYTYSYINPDFFLYDICDALNNMGEEAFFIGTSIKEIPMNKMFFKSSITITKKSDTKHETILPYNTRISSKMSEFESDITKITENSYTMSYIDVCQKNYKDELLQNLVKNISYETTDRIRLNQNENERYYSFICDNSFSVPLYINAYSNENYYYNNGSDYASILLFIEKIRNDFNTSFKYTLDPPDKEDGYRDSIDYFLNESHQGYCMHFATAATLLLQSKGIPARYAEGYVVSAAEISRGKTVGNIEDEFGNITGKMKRIEVPDKKAHAWVEIFIQGYGWVPVEFTPGYISSNNTLNYVRNGSEADTTQAATSTSQNKTTEPANKQHTDISQITSQENTATANNTGIATSKDNGNAGTERELPQGVVAFIWIALIILLAVLSLVVSYKLQHQKMNELLSTKNNDLSGERVKKIYGELVRIFEYLNIDKKSTMSYSDYIEYVNQNFKYHTEIDTAFVIKLAVKAQFGAQDMKFEKTEVNEACEIVKNTGKSVYNGLGKGQKIVYRYFKKIYC